MKALKYGLTLVLGLSMLGFSARVQAQASGQTANVVPAHAAALSDVAVEQDGLTAQQAEEQPQRGIPTPKAIEDLMDQGDYETAVKEFDKFIKTAKGNPCDLIYLPMSFYDRLAVEDTSKTDYYKAQAKSYLDKYMQTCGNTADAYLLQERFDKQTPEVTVTRMTQAIKLDPDYIMPYTVRGNALWALGRTNEACADFTKAKELGDADAVVFLSINCGNQE